MKINVWAESHNYSNYSNFLAFYKLIKKWEVNFPNITFERKTFLPSSEREKLDQYKFENRKFIRNIFTSCFYFIIENEDNNKYFLISYADNAKYINWDFKTNYDYENMVEFFTAQGCNEQPDRVLKESTINYTPINKIFWSNHTYEEIERLEKNQEDNIKKRIIPDKLFFASTKYNFRHYLIENDNRFNSFCTDNLRLSEQEHVRELNKYWINMDVYSVSGVSTRLIEGFALGTAVLSPKFPQKHHAPIIPDYHFVEVPFDEENIDSSNFKKLADSYIETFENLKKDKEKIYFISKNARQYYLDNCTIDQHVNLLYNLIDLKKII
jgi:hypothetical protein